MTEHRDKAQRGVERDEFGRPVVYYAEVSFENGAGNRCAFTTRDEAIFFAKDCVRTWGFDWSAWTAPRGQYPDETDRYDPRLSPTFVATCFGTAFGTAKATVTRLVAMTEWRTANTERDRKLCESPYARLDGTAPEEGK